jgi:hypothetical protein
MKAIVCFLFLAACVGVCITWSEPSAEELYRARVRAYCNLPTFVTNGRFPERDDPVRPPVLCR